MQLNAICSHTATHSKHSFERLVHINGNIWLSLLTNHYTADAAVEDALAFAIWAFIMNNLKQ